MTSPNPDFSKQSQSASVRNMIENADYHELCKIKSDLDSGGLHLKRLVESQLERLEKKSTAICVTCGKKIQKHLGDSSFTLDFGSKDFKRRASFCAVDCLKYFIDDTFKTVSTLGGVANEGSD